MVSTHYAFQFFKNSPRLATIYAFSRVMRKRNLRKLTGCSDKKIYRIRSDLMFNQRLLSYLENSLKHIPIYGPNIHESPELYIICRIWEPDFVVETGVAAGYSSTLILQALEDNGKGRLFSIDIGQRHFGRDIGWLVPKELQPRWTLYLESSQKRLKPLLEELGQINIFYHDSEHTYENMMFEYETSYAHIKSGGVLLTHDMGKAFYDFAKKVRRKPIRVLYGLGAIKK